VPVPTPDPINLGLRDRVVLVTGGVRGVGAGISEVFAGQGAVVVTCARRLVDGLPYEFRSCDVRDPAAVGGLIDAIMETHGRLDVVINNAGGSPYALAADASPRFHQKVIELNLLGMLYVSLAANAVMQRQSGGSIVSVSSVSGRRPSPGTAAYGAAKAGVDSLTSTLAVEWAPKVRVNAVVAGMVATEQSELYYGDSDSQAAVAGTVPMGRLANPAEIGWAAAFLASDLASYISGATLPVHGSGEPPAFLSVSAANKKQNR